MKIQTIPVGQLMTNCYLVCDEQAKFCAVVDPDAVVLGGGVSKAGQPLLDGAKRYFDKYIFHASRGIRFALASLGNDAGAYGAFKLALDAFGK